MQIQRSGGTTKNMKTTILILIILTILLLVYLKIKNKCAKPNPKNPVIKGTIFYHEDDFGQVEIIPSENFDRLVKEAENVQDFSEKHFDGGGYTDMYVRKENDLRLEAREIKVSELNEVLSKLSIEKHTIVTTGIRPGEMLSEDTFGYGENDRGLFFDVKDGIVSNIWISGRLEVNDETLIAVLNEIGTKWNLLLMDWNKLELVDLKSKEQLKKYVE